jgi:hypothetical protein
LQIPYLLDNRQDACYTKALTIAWQGLSRGGIVPLSILFFIPWLLALGLRVFEFDPRFFGHF